MNHLDDSEYLEKIDSAISNYVNPYAIGDDTNFIWLM